MFNLSTAALLVIIYQSPTATNICSNTYERFRGFLEVDNTYDGGGVGYVGWYPTILLWRLLVVGRLQLYPTHHVVSLKQLLVTIKTIIIIIIIIIITKNIIKSLVWLVLLFWRVGELSLINVNI